MGVFDVQHSFDKLGRPWPQTWQGQHRLNLILAWCWFVFGIFGLIDWLAGHYHWWHSYGIAKSIPILFGISVYANYVGHLSTAEAAKPESEAHDADKEADEQRLTP